MASDGLWDAFSDDDAGEVRSSVPPVWCSLKFLFGIELRHQHRYLKHVPVGNCWGLTLTLWAQHDSILTNWILLGNLSSWCHWEHILFCLEGLLHVDLNDRVASWVRASCVDMNNTSTFGPPVCTVFFCPCALQQSGFVLSRDLSSIRVIWVQGYSNMNKDEIMKCCNSSPNWHDQTVSRRPNKTPVLLDPKTLTFLTPKNFS